MRSLIYKLLLTLGLLSNQQAQAATPLDYDSLILLDAEALAEQGINEAYEQLLPQLKQFVEAPIKIEEQFSSKTGSYEVKQEVKHTKSMARNLKAMKLSRGVEPHTHFFKS
tara:strand:+ start:1356 stop:1688 length:333 start_codon:yes stop_codon:yes gene_type:complete